MGARSRLVKKNPWPEKIKFVILRDMERSGVRFTAYNSWMRKVDCVPTQAPTMGSAQQNVPCEREPYIEVKVIQSPHMTTDAKGKQVAVPMPYEWTPAEIYAAYVARTIQPVKQFAGWKELLEVGARNQRNDSAVRLVAPIHKSRLKYEEASPVDFTPAGLAHQGMEAEIADFTPIGAR